MMRLFIAINFSEEIKDDLCQVVQELKNCAVSGRFTHRDHLHLTVVFLGETSKLTEIIQVINEISAASFTLEIAGFGRFSHPGGHIYWLGLQENPVLTAIYAQLCTGLAQAGFVMEKRPYKPHLTLGREVVLKPDFDRTVFTKKIPAMKMAVSRISLIKSEHVAGQLMHREIYTKELKQIRP